MQAPRRASHASLLQQCIEDGQQIEVDGLHNGDSTCEDAFLTVQFRERLGPPQISALGALRGEQGGNSCATLDTDFHFLRLALEATSE